MVPIRLIVVSVLGVLIAIQTVHGKHIEGAPEGQQQDHRRTARSPSKTNNEEFEKFFLKASKSVPRIGRRGSFTNDNLGENSFNDVNKMQFNKYPFAYMEKRFGKSYRVPLWKNIADIYEYNPELPNSPDIFTALDQPQNDDAAASYDWNKIRFKRTPNTVPFQSQTKEIPEFRIQPDV